MKKILLPFILVLAFCASVFAQNSVKIFTNPLLPAAADPWVIYHAGYYYYVSANSNKLVIRKTKTMAGLGVSEKKVVWSPPAGSAYSKEVWAPELHYLQGKWYMYFAADDGHNSNHRLYVIENASADPQQGEWQFKGQLGDISNKWAIDGSVFELNKQLYLIWSGWEGDVNGQQNIYIAKMKNPYTVEGERVKISSPVYDWEKHGDLHDAANPPHVNVNEGPEILIHGDKVFLIYSASGCWTDFYSLGMLTASNTSNLMQASSWTKSPKPVFTQSAENSVYAPGHNAFFKSPDGKEDWIIYHANPAPGCGCGGQRSPRIQKFTWNADGSPNFGVPVKTGVEMNAPSE